MKRYELIDTIRGLAIISMIAFHTCWLLNFFGLGISKETLTGMSFLVWERSICMTFIIIAGFSFSLGRKHVRSGLILFVAGLIITLVTCMFIPGIRIVFGILTFLGSATLLMIPIDGILIKVRTRISNMMIFILFLLLFVAFYNINKGFLGYLPDMAVFLPKTLYKGYVAAYFGFMEPGFSSVDYFSLMPWFFLYICGYMLHKIVKGTAVENMLFALKIPGINILGKHSLAIYLIHPIVIFVLLAIVVRFI